MKYGGRFPALSLLLICFSAHAAFAADDCKTLIKQPPAGNFARWRFERRGQRFDRKLRKQLLQNLPHYDRDGVVSVFRNLDAATTEKLLTEYITLINTTYANLFPKAEEILKSAAEKSASLEIRALALQALADPPSREKFERAYEEKRAREELEAKNKRMELAEKEKYQRQMNFPQIGYWGYAASRVRLHALQEVARRSIYGLSEAERAALREVSKNETIEELQKLAASILQNPLEAWRWFWFEHSIYAEHVSRTSKIDQDIRSHLFFRTLYLRYIEDHVGSLPNADITALKYALEKSSSDREFIKRLLQEDARLKEEASVADPRRGGPLR